MHGKLNQHDARWKMQHACTIYLHNQLQTEK